VFKAVQNSNGVPVKFMATAGPDLADFSTVLEAIFEREDVYSLVPLTRTKAIQDAVASHCDSASSAQNGRWRICWLNKEATATQSFLTADASGDTLFATIEDDPDTSGTQYTRLTCAAADFIDNNVTAGNMTVRVNYVTNPQTGEVDYEEYVIDEVLTNEEIRLVIGPDQAVSVPSKIEIWKTNTKDEIATQVTTFSQSYSNRRVRAVWPDSISNGGVSMSGIYVAAALAGLRSGVNPHQGMTNVELAGFDSVTRTTEFLNPTQLNNMADNGVWIVTQSANGLVYTRHQLTTDTTDVNSREDSITTNLDQISYRFLRFFRDSRYIGRRNITPQLIVQLEADFKGLINSIVYESNTANLGPQILDASITELRRHPTLLDRVIATIEIDLPEPFNNFDITLSVVAG
jgi:hypothetical protein